MTSPPLPLELTPALNLAAQDQPLLILRPNLQCSALNLAGGEEPARHHLDRRGRHHRAQTRQGASLLSLVWFSLD